MGPPGERPLKAEPGRPLKCITLRLQPYRDKNNVSPEAHKGSFKGYFAGDGRKAYYDYIGSLVIGQNCLKLRYCYESVLFYYLPYYRKYYWFRFRPGFGLSFYVCGFRYFSFVWRVLIMVFNSNSKVHCFFEQSGTFKKQFLLLGIPALDYDIKNDFSETDYVVDLFEQIRLAFYGDNSVFDNVLKDDLVFAFFPCYRFEDQSRLLFRGDGARIKDWDLRKKITYSVELHDQLSELYRLFSFMVCICLDRGYRLVIENPYSSQHYLTSFWPGRPSVIDMDRSRHGDWFKKPTQYWFFNCEPSDHCYLVGDNYRMFEDSVEHLHKEQCLVMGCSDRKTGRSMIHSDYAAWFISEFIL